jgi:hypothetical protein
VVQKEDSCKGQDLRDETAPVDVRPASTAGINGILLNNVSIPVFIDIGDLA